MEDSASRSMEHVIGTLNCKWTIPVICVLQKDTLRYKAIERALPQPTQKVLTQTLRKLERNGIVSRTVYPTVPPQVEYKLTPLGLDLLTLSGVISEWSEIHSERIARAQKSYDRRLKV